ncbi:MAG: hypothetical protein N4A40_13715 [Tissierellales bacterium]|jgi:hypothetical protein|nr:hypothetical protein [Tissierellales bacterium]
MNKLKAINILKGQIEKLKDEKNLNDLWILETKTYVSHFFGENSSQVWFLRDFKWKNGIADDIIKSRDTVKTFLNDCISTIDNIGVKKETKQKLLNRIPDWSILPIISALIFIGTVFGRYQKDIAYIRMEEEVKSLKDSITSITVYKKAYKSKDVSDNSKGD